MFLCVDCHASSGRTDWHAPGPRNDYADSFGKCESCGKLTGCADCHAYAGVSEDIIDAALVENEARDKGWHPSMNSGQGVPESGSDIANEVHREMAVDEDTGGPV